MKTVRRCCVGEENQRATAGGGSVAGGDAYEWDHVIVEVEVINQKRRCRGHPRVATVVDKVVIQRLTNADLPSWRQVAAELQVYIE